jgi:hypothetical protein
MKQKGSKDCWSSKAGDENRLFPPQYEEAEEAQTALLLVLRRDPQQFGYNHSRWTLAMVLESCPWLTLNSPAGLCQLFKRLRIRYKRGREYVHSPDPHYEEKLSVMESLRAQALAEPARYVFLYLDELTYYRQPTLARAYEALGHLQPLAQRSYHSNTHFRVLAALNAWTGQLTYRQRSQTNLACLVNFWNDLRQAYPTAEQLFVVVDNWPLHFHPDVLAPLQAQAFPFPRPLPAHWPTEPSAQALVDDLPIQLLALPTYASWLNPIEKLWRWLKQDILHLHRQSDAWPELKQRVDGFLAQFAHGSTELLRYTGLLPI